MILLDTNVVSAMMRLDAEPAVAAWLGRQVARDIATTAITTFELRLGIEMLPAGKRRKRYEEALVALMAGPFARGVVPFDYAAAAEAGRIRARQLARGRNVAIPDSQIAGIARSVGAAIATRNTMDFAGLGIPLVDPWAG